MTARSPYGDDFTESLEVSDQFFFFHLQVHLLGQRRRRRWGWRGEGTVSSCHAWP